MSRTTTIGLAVAILIASAFLVAARDTSKTIEVANYPALTNEVEPQVVARTPRAALNGISGSVEASFGVSALAENAYDFNNIDGIPGFGTLPPTYDSAPVMPKIGSQ
jgi:hypothetical protein